MRVLTTLALATTAVVAFQQPEQDSPVMLVQGQVPPVNNLRALKGQLEETNQVKNGKVRRRLGFWTGAAGGVVGAAAGKKLGEKFLGRHGGKIGAVVGGVGGAVFGSKLNFRRNKSKRAENPDAGGEQAQHESYHYGSSQESAGHYGQESAGHYGEQYGY
ncbi:hypothetical protein AC1031_011460 [Aphanomyces cochlioides]|nr:hypothetical protein AC1031_011450 [Aphanomyces cochlioides]KAG9399647.1 hypothetical protein AC1031_011460 [Aphanomyces cochlioides]